MLLDIRFNTFTHGNGQFKFKCTNYFSLNYYFSFASVLDRRKFSFFITTVLFHYDFEADNLADASEILSHASVEKENFLCHLNSVTLGKIVNDI